MKNISPLIILALATTGWSVAAAAPDLSKLPPASDKQGVTYAKDIRPILEASCFRCHGGDKHRGDLHLDSLEGVLQGGEDGKVVMPGNSKESPLVLAVSRLDEEKAMPPKPREGRGGPGGRGGVGAGVVGGPQRIARGGKGGGKKTAKAVVTPLDGARGGQIYTRERWKMRPRQF